jgi:class 3 adenylate cyclase
MFVSYSSADNAIRPQALNKAGIVGNPILMDASNVPAGKEWLPTVKKMIHVADAFLLLWSPNSKKSKWVTKEWKYALSLRGPNFIKPYYWEDPLPTPPKALEKLQFKKISVVAVKRSGTAHKLGMRTIMFDDIVGSTPLRRKLGDDQFESLFEEHNKIVEEIAGREGAGSVKKILGDGLMVSFDAPFTAVERAIEIQSAFCGHAHFRLRIGIDMGQVMHTGGGEREDVDGLVVTRARRITDAAHEGGHVLVSKSVYDAYMEFQPASARIKWKFLGSHCGKPGEEPIEIYEAYDPDKTTPLPAFKPL